MKCLVLFLLVPLAHSFEYYDYLDESQSNVKYDYQPKSFEYSKVTTKKSYEYKPEESQYNAPNTITKKPVYDLKDAPKLFEKFIQDYNKQYKDADDYYKHYNVFLNNLKEIITLNKEGGSATYDINMFADKEDDETSDYDGGLQ